MSDKTHVEHNESARTLITDVPGDIDLRLQWANSGLMHRSEKQLFDHPGGGVELTAVRS
jgi:hypothetical protein